MDGQSRHARASVPIVGTAMLLVVLGVCLRWIVLRKHPDVLHSLLSAFGNWTATSVVEMSELIAVFADHHLCYAGFGFLKPSSPDLTPEAADSALTSLGRGVVEVDPWMDGWMRFCITT